MIAAIPERPSIPQSLSISKQYNDHYVTVPELIKDSLIDINFPFGMNFARSISNLYL